MRKTTRNRDLIWIVLGGVGLAIGGWIATALLVGALVGIGGAATRQFAAVFSTPTESTTPPARQPSVTPTFSVPNSLDAMATPAATMPAAPATATPQDSVARLPVVATATPIPPTPSPAPIAVTLPVYRLSTTCALAGCRFAYPSSVAVQVPSSYAGAIDAYGVAGLVVVAPQGWTGDGRVGVQGNTFVSLRPVESFRTPGPWIRVTIEVYGEAVLDATPFFEQARKDAQQTWHNSGRPTPAGMTQSSINSRLVAYRLPDTADGLGIDGVAWFTDQAPGAVFKQMEVALPVSQRRLSTVLLNAFIAGNTESRANVVPRPTEAPPTATVRPVVATIHTEFVLRPGAIRTVTIPNVGYGHRFGGTISVKDGRRVIFSVVGPTGVRRSLPVGGEWLDEVPVNGGPYSFAVTMVWDEPNTLRFENRGWFLSSDVVLDYWYER